MKKPTKKSIVKSLQAKAERLWKEYAIKRDGRECQVAKQYPELKIVHTNCIQVDHFISRRNKEFFVDPKNSTVVCSSCNRMKCFHQKSVDRIIDEIVLAREGEFWFKSAIAKDMSKGSFPDWSNVVWLEAQCEMLEKMIGGV